MIFGCKSRISRTILAFQDTGDFNIDFAHDNWDRCCYWLAYIALRRPIRVRAELTTQPIAGQEFIGQPTPVQLLDFAVIDEVSLGLEGVEDILFKVEDTS